MLAGVAVASLLIALWVPICQPYAKMFINTGRWFFVHLQLSAVLINVINFD